MRRLIAALSISLSLAGCAPTSPPDVKATASGRPEITTSANTATAKSKLANFYAQMGYVVKLSNDMQIVFDRQSQNVAVQISLTCMTCQLPRSRLSFDLIQTGRQTRIIADHNIVANEGTPAERRLQMLNDRIRADVQAELEQIFGKE